MKIQRLTLETVIHCTQIFAANLIIQMTQEHVFQISHWLQ
eukprot:COSAG02_NODE_17_length_55377_cov_106.402258_18_plen_40_part_00